MISDRGKKLKLIASYIKKNKVIPVPRQVIAFATRGIQITTARPTSIWDSYLKNLQKPR